MLATNAHQSRSVPRPETMSAVVATRYGGPEVLETAEVATPTPGKGEVLVAVEAAGIDRGVWHLVKGEPLLVRAGFGLRRPRVATPGFDLAGTVVSVGAEVSRFQVGDEVFGIGKSTYAQYAVAPAKKLVHKPASLPWDQAGAATISGITALEGLTDKGRLQAGQRVLVLGASGGVGSFAVQIAVALGAEVIGVASAAKANFVTSLGARRCLDYAAGSVVEYCAAEAPFDLIFDCGGRNSLRALRSLLTPKGSLIIVGGEGGGAIGGGFGRNLRAAMLSPFVGHHMPAFLSKESLAIIEPLCDLIADGRVVPAIDRRYPLIEAGEALADLEAGVIRGKAVIVPSSRGRSAPI